VKNQQNRLLVVDGDLDNRALLSQRLSRRGYQVEVAGDGPQALKKIQQCQCDLVLLDQMMPGTASLDLLRLLRASYSPRELPVIVLGKQDQSHGVVDALNHGANDYVVKPVELPLITARIEAQLASLRAPRRSGPASLNLVDKLTGVGNRLYLFDRLRLAIDEYRDALLDPPALLLIDIDGFKKLNELNGRKFGDLVLAEIAARLQTILAKVPFCDSAAALARVGGDEFAVLLPKARDIAEIEPLAHEIQRELRKPLGVNGSSAYVTASAGIAVCTDEHRTPEDLVRDAGIAIYRAKEKGAGGSEVFEPHLRVRALARMSMASDLRRAVERGELVAHYQPKVHLATGAILGFEALMRWQHPERGLLPPAEFIPLAEETGMIVKMGEWILSEACHQLSVWQKRYPRGPGLTMSVNLSVKQLLQPDLVDRIGSILRDTGIAPDSLRLELTESCLMKDLHGARVVLDRLRALNVGLKLDDFGTGYASLAYLQKVHFDALKIDRSFVSDLGAESESSEIVRNIVQLANSLHMRVVAEGIETQQQLSELRRLGCETGQGFYFSKPVDAESATRLLDTGVLAHCKIEGCNGGDVNESCSCDRSGSRDRRGHRAPSGSGSVCRSD
jgi:diguanylate cyclase (GGDEF)-like protein